MRKSREFIQGAFYHVTSRTNDKIRVFENNLGRRIMLITLQDAKDKFGFRLANFCVMPTHIHLLIEPGEGSNLSMIMHRIKMCFAKRWNRIHGSKDHVWGRRYFARAVNDPQEYEFVMNYIDQNPVEAGLSPTAAEWPASGAYYRERNIHGLVDFSLTERREYTKTLSPVPPLAAKLLPPAQFEHTEQYYGAYAEAVDRLNALVPAIPRLGDTGTMNEPPIYLHYFTGTADYFICEYDGEDTMYGKVRFSVYPAETECRKFNLSGLKSNQFMQPDLSWVPDIRPVPATHS